MGHSAGDVVGPRISSGQEGAAEALCRGTPPTLGSIANSQGPPDGQMRSGSSRARLEGIPTPVHSPESRALAALNGGAIGLESAVPEHGSGRHLRNLSGRRPCAQGVAFAGRHPVDGQRLVGAAGDFRCEVPRHHGLGSWLVHGGRAADAQISCVGWNMIPRVRLEPHLIDD
jgi:hypothetical protein